MLNGLDLFSGIGGLSLALSGWVKPIAYCENDRYAQSVLLSRMQSGQLELAPIWDDVCTLRGEHFGTRSVDIIYGGFPCQDISVAGAGRGLVGERSRLFWQIERLIKETNPRFVFLENVPAIRTRGLNSVIQSLAELGYDCRWTIVSAKEVGACHVRKRWFMLAHSSRSNLRQQSGRSEGAQREATAIDAIDGKPWADSNSNGPGLEGVGRSESKIPRPVVYNGWVSEPTVCRRDNGIPHKSHRLRGLGNAVVPAQAREAFKRLCGLE